MIIAIAQKNKQRLNFHVATIFKSYYLIDELMLQNILTSMDNVEICDILFYLWFYLYQL